ncbi:hypothetical protein K435DRAFT_872458 [Dendrothele bispora CBS 962.96]|uniref:Uncharacterized protein n=1 Tax=Dendrothele bispora (strain CBS 962.96) TaxID=1314807 RepID=A0A4S8L1I7_DENBC|nr:hypothetical protein K435DRAFT_872458 [Dendrothele bispora CBS 962.96]
MTLRMGPRAQLRLHGLMLERNGLDMLLTLTLLFIGPSLLNSSIKLVHLSFNPNSSYTPNPALTNHASPCSFSYSPNSSDLSPALSFPTFFAKNTLAPNTNTHDPSDASASVRKAGRECGACGDLSATGGKGCGFEVSGGQLGWRVAASHAKDRSVSGSCASAASASDEANRFSL